ncbi:hypothetical protein M9H77_15898 [Catharanthus roseus]|uniref:Uncharacterized protein n=1 Tax=Catharanthus roseus TaxID=4058 RepID=A0ACC0B065_CATRO|nr:hypothetical protein M9H77_15898 [Catharanthus roseus]
MGSFSGLGIGLSFVFGFILLGLVAELYYLLWWKKRKSNREIEDHLTNYGTELSFLFCWKKPNAVVSRENSTEGLTTSVVNPELANGHHGLDLELGTGKDMNLKGFGEESIESELMRLHNLCGPPRFLCTIKEETMEDLESDDGKSRGDRSRKGSRTKSLSDLILAVDNTPFLTPLPSPPLKVPSLDSYNHQGFNPLFESMSMTMSEAELNRLRSSPPPKFKFLRDAEEKLIKRLVEEAERKALKSGGNVQDSVMKVSANPIEEKEGSFIALIAKNKEREMNRQQPSFHSTPSQVLPLASSPSTTFRPLDNKSSMR